MGQYTVARVRGSTSSNVGIYLDGVLMNLTSEVAVDLSTIPMENVARIEVYRGYVPARFAGAPMGGVINIVTKKPSKIGGSVSQGISSFGGYKASYELTTPLGGGSLLIGVNRDSNDGDFKYTNMARKNFTGSHPGAYETPADRHRTNNDYRNNDALIKWQDEHWLVKAAHKDIFRHIPTAIDLMDAAGGANDDTPGYVTGNYQKIRQNDLLVGRRQTDGNLEWGWQLEWMDQDKSYRAPKLGDGYGMYPGAAWSWYKTKRLGGALDGAWKLGDSHLLEFYAGASHEEMDTQMSNRVGGAHHHTSIDEGRFLTYYDIDRYRLQLQDTITLNRSRNLWLTPVLKMDRLQMTGGSDFENAWKYSGGVGLKKEFNEHWTARASWGTFNRYPNFYEIFGDSAYLRPVHISFPQPTWESGTNWDLGVTWQGETLGAQSDVTLTYFHNYTKNLSQLYTAAGTGISFYTNTGAGTAQGVELESKLKWDRWDLQLSATWTDTVVEKYWSPTWSALPGYVQAAWVGQPYANIPEWEGNLRLAYRFPDDKLSLFAEQHYTGTTPLHQGKDGDGIFQRRYTITNLGIKYQLSQQIKINAGVNDVFNNGPAVYRYQYYSRGSGADNNINQNIQYPMQGRTYYMSVQYLF
jgi:outer membrane receptor protein involved in Fe transport